MASETGNLSVEECDAKPLCKAVALYRERP